ncbi:MAG TPA: hypothetical protein VKA01_17445, partial [Vicinamibacteria bacterium]|nr:hypothetical protein [Vicinamibacteria bacterium]
MDLLDVVVAVGWAGAGSGPKPTGHEAGSAVLALLITAWILRWGRRIERERARKFLPFRRIVVVCAFLGVTTPVAAQEPGQPEASGLDIAGFVDGVFAYNANKPADHANFFPGVGTSGKRDNELAINLA